MITDCLMVIIFVCQGCDLHLAPMGSRDNEARCPCRLERYITYMFAAFLYVLHKNIYQDAGLCFWPYSVANLAGVPESLRDIGDPVLHILQAHNIRVTPRGEHSRVKVVECLNSDDQSRQ